MRTLPRNNLLMINTLNIKRALIINLENLKEETAGWRKR